MYKTNSYEWLKCFTVRFAITEVLITIWAGYMSHFPSQDTPDDRVVGDIQHPGHG